MDRNSADQSIKFGGSSTKRIKGLVTQPYLAFEAMQYMGQKASYFVQVVKFAALRPLPEEKLPGAQDCISIQNGLFCTVAGSIYEKAQPYEDGYKAGG